MSLMPFPNIPIASQRLLGPAVEHRPAPIQNNKSDVGIFSAPFPIPYHSNFRVDFPANPQTSNPEKKRKNPCEDQ